MPSEKIVEKSSFFRKQLEHGAKAFRYRQGVRALLGLAENKEEVRFARPLPPIDLRSLNALRPKLALKTQNVVLKNKSPHPDEISAPPNIQKKELQNGRAVSSVVSASNAMNTQVEAIFKNSEPPHRENKTSQILPPLSSNLQDKKYTAPDILPPNFTEESQIDIPGYSKNRASFPALTQTAEEEVETPEGSKNQSPLPQENPKGKAATPQMHKPLASTVFTFKNEKASIVKSLEGFETDKKEQVFTDHLRENKGIKSTSRVIQALHLPAHRQNGSEHKTEPEKPLVPQQVSAGKVSKVMATPPALKTETLIKQRPYIKASSKENNAETPEQKSHPEKREQTSETQTTQTAPIVIVKQVPPQSKAPPAFWERRYLSHAALRLRILR